MTNVQFLAPLRVLAVFFVLVLPAHAAAPATYTGTAPVNTQSDDERAGALRTALANVVVAQTGDSTLIARPDVAKAVDQAERYVLQYQYRPNNGDDAAAKMTLVARFDSVAVDRMLQRLGIGGGEQSALPSETPSEATVWIGGIRSADDYAHVIAYLGKNNFVRSAQPVRARGDGMLVKLALATDLAHFLDAVGTERTLGVVNASAGSEPADATLTLVQ